MATSDDVSVDQSKDVGSSLTVLPGEPINGAHHIHDGFGESSSLLSDGIPFRILRPRKQKSKLSTTFQRIIPGNSPNQLNYRIR